MTKGRIHDRPLRFNVIYVDNVSCEHCWIAHELVLWNYAMLAKSTHVQDVEYPCTSWNSPSYDIMDCVVICNEHDIESYASIYMLYEIPFHEIDCWEPCLVWNLLLMILWIMDSTLMIKSVMCVSFLPSSPGGTCTWTI